MVMYNVQLKVIIVIDDYILCSLRKAVSILKLETTFISLSVAALTSVQRLRCLGYMPLL